MFGEGGFQEHLIAPLVFSAGLRRVFSPSHLMGVCVFLLLWKVTGGANLMQG